MDLRSAASTDLPRRCSLRRFMNDEWLKQCALQCAKCMTQGLKVTKPSIAKLLGEPSASLPSPSSRSPIAGPSLRHGPETLHLRHSHRMTYCLILPTAAELHMCQSCTSASVELDCMAGCARHESPSVWTSGLHVERRD